MPKPKRQRHKEGRARRLEAERAAARRRSRRRRLVSAVVAAAVVFGLLVLVSQVGGDGDQAAAPTTTSDVAGEDAEAGAPTFGEGECPPPEPPDEPRRQFSDAPRRCIHDGVDYRARLVTSRGEVTIDLLEDRAPATVNNFVSLARWGFYRDSQFHRIIPGFVVQGGDPVGQPPGTGGPGYEIADELPEAGSYQVGSVAMANSGPDTNGSQFFIVTGEQGVGLPPMYSLFGEVTEGMDVVMAIEATGTPEGDPTEPTTLQRVEILEG